MTAASPAQSFFRVEELPVRRGLDGIRLRSVELQNLMMTFVEYPAGSRVPAHHHPCEQITYVLEGLLEVTVGDEQRVLGSGEGVRVPPHTEHSSRPIDGPAKALDAWTPVPQRFTVETLATLGHHVPIVGESLS
jgi:unsaturated pyranuronate lyase